MGLVVFLIVSAAILPGVICLFLSFMADGLLHGRVCVWCYFWMGEGLGAWQLWRASRPETDVSYMNGILILGFTNIALAFFIIVRSRRRALAKTAQSDGDRS